MKKRQRERSRVNGGTSPAYLRDEEAPKLARTFLTSRASLSLSPPVSVAGAFFLLRAFAAPPALVGVGAKLALNGVAEPDSSPELAAALLGLYDRLEREKTRCWSRGPALRRCAAAACEVPLV